LGLNLLHLRRPVRWDRLVRVGSRCDIPVTSSGSIGGKLSQPLRFLLE